MSAPTENTTGRDRASWELIAGSEIALGIVAGILLVSAWGLIPAVLRAALIVLLIPLPFFVADAIRRAVSPTPRERNAGAE